MTYLIDGYNLLHALGMVTSSATPVKFRRAREEMLEWLNTAHPSPEDLLVIFDARKAPRLTPGEQLVGAVRVRFAHHMFADDMIEDIIQAARTPAALTVVSNDMRVQEAGRRRGCVVWRTDDLVDATLKGATKSSPRDPPKSDKPDSIGPDEMQEFLDAFGESDDDGGTDRRGFGWRK